VIKEFDKNNLTTLRNDFDTAMRQLAAKHGVRIRLKTLRYDTLKANGTVEFIAVGDANTATDPQAAQLAIYKAEFAKYAASFGLKPEQHGSIIKSGRDTYKLVGLKPKAPKRPILAQNVADGRIYILTESSIAPLQSKEHKNLFGIGRTADGERIKTVDGQCSNDHAYDTKFNPIGQCNRTPTTFRKSGFGKSARTLPYCDQCARLIDESRAEMEAEARSS
jgi:hypothetical protein